MSAPKHVRRLRAAAAAALALAALAGCASSGNRATPERVPPPIDAPAGPDEKQAGTQAGPRAGDGAAAASAPREDARGASRTAAADTASTSAELARTAIGTVGGTPLALGDLFASWLRRDGAAARTLLDDLVLSRIVELEAARLGVELPVELVKRSVDARRKALEQEAEKAGAKDLDRFIRTRLGIPPEAFFAGTERDVVIDLLASRVVRGWLLATERAEVRVIAVSTQEATDRVQAKLAAGESFADVAGELSEDSSREDGGRMAPVVRGESQMARLAFATAVGEVSGPIRDSGRTLFLKVDARPEPDAGPWSEMGPKVEASLAARGIEDPEYWQWQQAMEAVYEVDLGTFFDVAAELGGGAAR